MLNRLFNFKLESALILLKIEYQRVNVLGVIVLVFLYWVRGYVVSVVVSGYAPGVPIGGTRVHDLCYRDV